MTEEIQHLTAAEEHNEHTSTNHADTTPFIAASSTEDTLKPTHAPANRDTDEAVTQALFASDESAPIAEPPTPTSESEAPPLLEPIDPESYLPELSADHLAPLPPTFPVEPELAVSASSRPNLAVDALSDVGCVRTNNEDAYGYDLELGLFVICDGMGGMAAGEVASSNSVAALVHTFAESAGTALPIGARLQQAVHTANTTVWDMGQQPEHKGMGTTAVAAAIDGQKLVIANVGDSRAYVIQDGVATQITVDHSYINELIRNGTLTKENAHLADLHGYESVITRAIGVSETVEPDYYSVDLTPGTQILLATDGLTRYLNGDEIATIVQATPFESTCANLIDLAKRRGGHDNITCLLLLVLPPESTSQPEPQPVA
ncbi:Stp1/IreP family PP2C-type Ser/Thr phosphatase [Terracidiphilus gabretensis]|uniref:Stp1/IreP family PP2C-type Ser/Thr phosphatase n=1 Tax=Terracidiphilus gabretensis TaxID=1577687 RepID=UPI00071BCD8C|nr:Stp1/IreP family PP2C-type Ser/Thr phosphatase [Terracidiphilus gabretensis]